MKPTSVNVQKLKVKIHRVFPFVHPLVDCMHITAKLCNHDLLIKWNKLMYFITSALKNKNICSYISLNLISKIIKSHHGGATKLHKHTRNNHPKPKILKSGQKKIGEDRICHPWSRQEKLPKSNSINSAAKRKFQKTPPRVLVIY